MHFSLRSLFLIFVYAAVCCLVYVFANLWIGTLVVAATILLLCYTTVAAYRHRDVFTLSFSVFAWSWMVFWLGFYAETGPNSQPWEIPRHVNNAMKGFRQRPSYNPNSKFTKFGFMHSLHISGPMGTVGDTVIIPTSHNAIRLAVCLSSLTFGLIGSFTAVQVQRRFGRSRSTPDYRM